MASTKASRVNWRVYMLEELSAGMTLIEGESAIMYIAYFVSSSILPASAIS